MPSNIAAEILPAPKSPYAAGSDHFKRRGCQAVWEFCREFFHKSFNKEGQDKGLYYNTPHVKSVAAMFQWVEDVLNIRKDQRSLIFKCEPLKMNHWDSPYCNRSRTVYVPSIWVQLAPFWLSLKSRTYFVTIMLRAAGKYPPAKNFDPLDALMRSLYCADTPRATALFLSGYTIVRAARHTGWVSRFHNPQRTINLELPVEASELVWFEGGCCDSRLTIKERRRLADWIEKYEGDNAAKDGFVYTPKKRGVA